MPAAIIREILLFSYFNFYKHQTFLGSYDSVALVWSTASFICILKAVVISLQSVGQNWIEKIAFEFCWYKHITSIVVYIEVCLVIVIGDIGGDYMENWSKVELDRTSSEKCLILPLKFQLFCVCA